MYVEYRRIHYKESFHLFVIYGYVIDFTQCRDDFLLMTQNYVCWCVQTYMNTHIHIKHIQTLLNGRVTMITVIIF